MKTIIIILCYIIPAILATIVLSLLEKNQFYGKLKKFDESNSGKVYDFIKSVFIIFLFFFFIFSFIYGLCSGIYIAQLFMDNLYFKAIVALLIATLTDCILFYGSQNF